MKFTVLLLLGCSITSVLSFDHHVRYDGKTEVWEGEPFEISCVINKHDVPGWTLNNTLVIFEDNDQGYSLSERTIDTFYHEMMLEVNSAQMHHEGEYRCNKYSRDFHTINVLPSFEDAYEGTHKEESVETKSENEYILQINQTIEFYCSSGEGEGDEDDTAVTWYKNSRRIVENSESNIILSDLSLVIEDAQEDDAGEYMCTVDKPYIDGYTDIGRIFHLNSPAKVIDLPEKESFILNRSLSLHCKAQGFPQPKITWLIGNEDASELKKTDHRIRIYSDGGGQPNSFLVIHNVKPSDKGLYTCVATNSVDSSLTEEEDEESVFVYIRENMIVTNEDEPGMGKMLVPGEPLVLYCNTSDCPHCVVEWFKDGEPLHSIPDHLEVFRNNTVVIDSADYKDSGVYLCAIDKNQLDIALNATIVVQSKIKLDKFDQSSVVVQGTALELYCNAKGSPPPYIKWFIGDQEIYEGDERVLLLEYEGLPKGKLLIEQADYPDRNHYTCEAFNQLDSVNTTVFIRIKDKLAALWPFLGICVEVAILITIIFVYERRKSKNQSEEPETDLPADNKHHRNQKGKAPDVRQRK